jgi:predicted PurR-regulated permease PerM
LFFNPIKALWVAIFILLLQQLDGLLIAPKILGDSVGLRPFWIIVAIILGGGLFGLLGMLLGVPIFAVLKVILDELVEKRLKEKQAY